jgi:hypothetical protein
MSTKKRKIGNYQLVPVENDIMVANIIGQESIKSNSGESYVPPVRYIAIQKALENIYAFAESGGYSIHMPKIGSDRAGGDWYIIEFIINKINNQYPNVSTTVYIYNGTQFK